MATQIPDIDDIRAVLEEVLEERLADLAPPPPQPLVGEVRGINPHALYTAARVAELLSYDSPETVLRSDLPRAPWRGPGVRYWGCDVLTYMGVPAEELGAVRVHRMATAKRARAAEKGRRVKNNRLPEL
jgi:hypothetical protein